MLKATGVLGGPPIVDYGYLGMELRASKSLAIRGPLTMGVPLVMRKPHSFQRTEWIWAIKRAHQKVTDLPTTWCVTLGSARVMVSPSLGAISLHQARELKGWKCLRCLCW